MSNRDKHLFQFTAQQIAEAAKCEQEYHAGRMNYWKNEYDTSVKDVESTIGAKLVRKPVTGGYRVDVEVNYGDPLAYARMQESFQKISFHRDFAERFATDAKVYGTQHDRSYELSTEDVHYYRLGGGQREE